MVILAIENSDLLYAHLIGEAKFQRTQEADYR